MQNKPHNLILMSDILVTWHSIGDHLKNAKISANAFLIFAQRQFRPILFSTRSNDLKTSHGSTHFYDKHTDISTVLHPAGLTVVVVVVDFIFQLCFKASGWRCVWLWLWHPLDPAVAAEGRGRTPHPAAVLQGRSLQDTPAKHVHRQLW